MSINLTRTFFVLLLLAGCSSSGIPLVGISGKVLLGDGAPLKQGEIIFTSGDYSERAPLSEDGAFQVDLPKGNYQVFFLGTTVDHYPSNTPPTYLVPKKYTDLTTTDLTLDVQEANHDVTIQVPAAASK